MEEDVVVVEGRLARAGPLEWAAERISTRLHGRVLDVGCGEGRFLPAGGVGLDLAFERLLAARRESALLVRADAHALPFADRTFDTVLANRMLNDAGRVDEVLAEIARVLRIGGGLLVLTLAHAERSLLRTLHDEARTTLALRRRRTTEDRLDDDNGEARLRRHFAAVSAERYRVEHRLPDVAAALDHYARRYLADRHGDPGQRAGLFDRVRRGLLQAAPVGEIVDVERATLFIAEL